MKQNTPVPTENAVWPELPAPEEWKGTLEAVHLWTQVIGKVRLEHMPWINHSWHVPLYISSRGLTTSLIPHSGGGFEMEFDLLSHLLEIRNTDGRSISFALEPMSVADFYRKTMAGLRELDLETEIYPMPVELPDPIVPFPENSEQAPYDADAVYRFWLALTCIHRVFTRFRAKFTGKVSPVHFFWGSFDLAVTRFSGRSAPRHPGGVPNCPDRVMEDGYSHELSSAGFWAGTGLGEAAFYSYVWPEPEGFRTADVSPGEARYHEELGEFILPYRAVQQDSNPDEKLMEFLRTTYEAAAETAGWNRDELEYQENHRG